MWVLMTARGQQLAIRQLPAVLGNAPEADVRVPHESVIAQHARLSEGSAGTLRIEALGAGSVGVGGRPVERSLLRDGDELTLGRVKFTLCARPDPGAEPPADLRAASGAASRRAAPGTPVSAAQPAAPELLQRRRELQFRKVEARRGLLNADLSQLPAGQRVAVTLGVLLLAAALMAGVAWLVGLIG